MGSEVLIDDGLISMTVVSKTDTSVTCKVANNGLLGQVPFAPAPDHRPPPLPPRPALVCACR